MREITQFSYDPEAGTPFSTWMGRFEAVLGNHGMQLSDYDKTGALLSKLDWRPTTTTPITSCREVLKDVLGDKISVVC